MKVTIVPPLLPDIGGGRWCEHCKHRHGVLYLCPYYPDDVKVEALVADAHYRAALRKAEQDKSRSPVELTIWRMFAGPDPGEE
jgi:hypothetical protein